MPVPANPVPESWLDWITYLNSQPTPAHMREAIDVLRSQVFGLPRDEALAWLMDFLESGVDLPTGLAFQVGAEGRLTGAGSLRAVLLDWLGQLDAGAAATIAGNELVSMGTGLPVDVYAIHMRNFAWGKGDSADTRRFLRDQVDRLLNHEPWLENPGTAVAEAMDVAVYAGATNSVPELAGLMNPDQPQMLRHASALALERLVDRYPMETLDQLLDTVPRQPEIAAARAGYFARLDPATPGAGDLLDRYLASPQLSRAEAVAFLESFPNLNQSFSHNLLSRNISNTPPGGYVGRLENALDQVREWRDNPGLAPLAGTLGEVEERIRQQLGGTSAP